MSKSEGDNTTSEKKALKALDSAVGRLLKELVAVRQRAEAAETRQAEVETLLKAMSDGKANPADMADRLKQLEAENEDLRARVDEGYAGVERLISQVRFLEEQG